MKLNIKIPVCFFDLETTGTNITQDRIIEIAVIKLMPNGEMIRKAHLINPTIPIPAASSAIHGIFDKDVADKPAFKAVAKEYAKLLEGADLSGFSIMRFDLPLLVEEFLRAEVEFDYERKKVIDAQKIYHLMEKRNLAAAYEFYCNKKLEDSHTAEADTEASMQVLMAQISKYENQQVTDSLGKQVGQILNDMDTLHQLTASNMIDLAGRMTRNDNGEAIFNFGKHRNKGVLDVFREEPAYYDWMMNGDFPMDTKRKLTEIRLKGMSTHK
jgi:DNA polymerase-3 subunit epsilon